MPDDSMGRFKMLLATERMTKALRVLRRFNLLSWDDAIDLVTTCVVDRGGIGKVDLKRHLLEKLITYRKEGKGRPADVPNLELELRLAIPQSYQVAEPMGGVTAVGSMVIVADDDYDPWGYYNPHLLIANFGEGGFARITGPPRSGKTNAACVVMEEWLNESPTHHAITNIDIPRDEHDRLHYVKDDLQFFRALVEIRINGGTSHRWVFALDEGGLIYDRKHDSPTRRANQLDKLARVIGKARGNLLFIEQSEESVPALLIEFGSMSIKCYRPGILNIILMQDKPTSNVAFDRVVRLFPKTLFPFNTRGIGMFNVHPKAVETLLEAETDSLDLAAIDRYTETLT